jgi:drug/metabolite transporter (DMT)-like permease
MRRPAAADLLMISVTLIWGLNFSIMKHAYDHFHPLAFTTVRFIVATLTLAVILKLRGMSLRVERSDLPAFIGLGVLSQTVYQILFVLGLASTRAGNAALLTSLTPVFAYLAGVLLGRETFRQKVLGGILISFAGVLCIVVFGSKEMDFGQSVRGDLLILGSSLCWGWYTGGATRLVVKYGALRQTFWLMLTGTAVLVPALSRFVLRQDWLSIPPGAWLEFGYSTFLAIVYCYLVWSYALEHLGVSGTAVYSNVTPAVALVGAWLLLGERPAIAQLVGIALILTGILLVRSRRSRPPENWKTPASTE